ncbi:MAG: TetR/AcrR family transcriptional regulator [Verrucomicrobiia bacterium]|jgi:AcrR family transcriptional regulator
MRQRAQRIPAAQRHQQILAVAAELFARQGFHGTTTRQIAEQAQVNEAILFRHFPQKEDLYWAVIEEKCREKLVREWLVEQLAAPADEKTVLTAVAVGLFERNAADTTLTRLLLFSALEKHELSARFVKTYVTGFYDLLAEYIRGRIRAGVFRRVDPVLVARGFLGMVLHHFLVQEVLGERRFHRFDVRNVCETFVDIWVKGMQAHPRGKD